MKHTATILLAAAALAIPGPRPAQAGEESATELRVRLSPPILNQAHRRALGLVAGDFNNDGRMDLAVASNDESILRLFLNEADPEADFPFRREDITLDRRVRSVLATDVNGNGRTDLVLAGQPASLVVFYQTEDGRLQQGPDLDIEAGLLVEGDLTGNGEADLLIVEGRKFSLLERTDGELRLEPRDLFFTTEDLTGPPVLLDITGNGLLDIVYSPAADRESVVIREQQQPGRFPVEFRVRTGLLRDLKAFRAGEGQDMLAAVHGRTYDLLLLRLAEAVEADTGRLALSTPRLIGFDPQTRDDNSFFAAADLNGNGRLDLVVATPSRPSMRLLLQTEEGSFQPRETPTLQDIQQILPWPSPDGGPDSLLLLSLDEQTVGVTRLDGSDLAFPRATRLAGEPLRIARARVAGHDGPALVAIEKADADGNVVRAYPGFSPGKALPEPVLLHDLSTDDATKNARVRGMRSLDLNRNGLDDLVVFFEFADPLVLLQDEEGSFAPTRAQGLFAGLLEGASEPLLSSTRLSPDGDTDALVVKPNFVRSFHLDEEGGVVVTQQFNATGARPRLRAAVAASISGGDEPEVAVLDASANTIAIHGRRDGAYAILRTVALGDAGFRSLKAIDLDGDGRDDLVALGPDRVAIVYSRVLNGGLDTIESRSSTEEQGGYGAVHALQLVDAPRPQIAAIEMQGNRLEFFDPVGEGGAMGLAKFFAFRVFDIESMMRRRLNIDRAPEPREMLVADLTGDGRNDLAVLVHDKVIVYRQVDFVEDEPVAAE